MGKEEEIGRSAGRAERTPLALEKLSNANFEDVCYNSKIRSEYKDSNSMMKIWHEFLW